MAVPPRAQVASSRLGLRCRKDAFKTHALGLNTAEPRTGRSESVRRSVHAEARRMSLAGRGTAARWHGDGFIREVTSSTGSSLGVAPPPFSEREEDVLQEIVTDRSAVVFDQVGAGVASRLDRLSECSYTRAAGDLHDLVASIGSPRVVLRVCPTAPALRLRTPPRIPIGRRLDAALPRRPARNAGGPGCLLAPVPPGCRLRGAALCNSPSNLAISSCTC